MQYSDYRSVNFRMARSTCIRFELVIRIQSCDLAMKESGRSRSMGKKKKSDKSATGMAKVSMSITLDISGIILIRHGEENVTRIRHAN